MSSSLALAIYWIMMFGVAAPASRIAKEVRRLSEGDLAVDVSDLEADTEIGSIARATARFRDNLTENRELAAQRESAEQASAARRAMREDLQTRIGTLVKSALNGDFDGRIGKTYDDAELRSSAAQIEDLLASFAKAVSEVGRVVGGLSEGDLTAQMTGFNQGAFGAIAVGRQRNHDAPVGNGQRNSALDPVDSKREQRDQQGRARTGHAD